MGDLKSISTIQVDGILNAQGVGVGTNGSLTVSGAVHATGDLGLAPGATASVTGTGYLGVHNILTGNGSQVTVGEDAALAANDVSIVNGAAVTVYGAANVHNVSVANGGTLTFDPLHDGIASSAASIDNFGIMNVQGTHQTDLGAAVLNQSATLTVASTAALKVDTLNALVGTGTNIAGKLTAASVNISPNATLTFDPSLYVNHAVTAVSNQGTLHFGGNGTADMSGTVVSTDRLSRAWGSGLTANWYYGIPNGPGGGDGIQNNANYLPILGDPSGTNAGDPKLWSLNTSWDGHAVDTTNGVFGTLGDTTLVPNVSLDPRFNGNIHADPGGNNYAVQNGTIWTGQFYVDAAHANEPLQFLSSSDDGSLVFIAQTTDVNDWDLQRVLNNNGNHGAPTMGDAATTPFSRAAGWYNIEIAFANGTGGNGCTLYWDQGLGSGINPEANANDVVVDSDLFRTAALPQGDILVDNGATAKVGKILGGGTLTINGGDFSTMMGTAADQSDIQALVLGTEGFAHFAGNLKCATDITIGDTSGADFSGGVDMAGRTINTTGYTTFAGSAGTGLITLANLNVNAGPGETDIMNGAQFDSTTSVTVAEGGLLQFMADGPEGPPGVTVNGPMAAFNILGTVVANTGRTDLGATALTGTPGMPGVSKLDVGTMATTAELDIGNVAGIKTLTVYAGSTLRTGNLTIDPDATALVQGGLYAIGSTIKSSGTATFNGNVEAQTLSVLAGAVTLSGADPGGGHDERGGHGHAESAGDQQRVARDGDERRYRHGAERRVGSVMPCRYRKTRPTAKRSRQST